MQKMDVSIGLQFMDRFTEPAKRVMGLGKKLRDTMTESQKQLNKIGNDKKLIRKYQDLNQSLSKTASRFNEAKTKATNLGRAIKKAEADGGQASKSMQRQYATATKALSRLNKQHGIQKQQLRNVRHQLRGAEIDTRNLVNEQDRLGKKFADVTKRMKSYAAEQAHIAKVRKNFDSSLQKAANISLVGSGMQNAGASALGLLARPTNSMRAVERSKGDLQALGIQNTDVIIKRGQELQRAFAYIDTASFTAAAYDIKSGIEGLSDTGVADITEQAALVAKATKSQTSDMTSLFGTGFGIFKDAQFSELTNSDFAGTFGAALTNTVKQFKTTGPAMQQAIESMGAGLTVSGVKMSEQLAALGMLQKTMTAGVAGTTLAAVERSSAQAQSRFQKAGSSVRVLDENGNMKSLADLLQAMQDEFGSDFTTETGFKIQEAFGSEEAVKFFKQLWGQQESLRKNSEANEEASKQAQNYTQSVAKAVDANNGDARLQRYTQRMEIISQKFGKAMLPFYEIALPIAEKFGSVIEDISENGGWLTKTFIGVVGGVGILGTVLGPIVTGIASLTVTAAWLKKSFIELGFAAKQSGGGGLGSGGGRRGRRGKSGLKGIMSSAKKYGKRLGGVGAALGVLSLGSTLMDDSLTAGQKAKETTKGVGSIGGGWGGAALGASIGTALLPGIGTVVGGAVGGLIGSELGSTIVDGIWSLFDKKDNDGETKVATSNKAKSAIAATGIAVAASLPVTASSPITKAVPQINDNSQVTIPISLTVPPGADEQAIAKLVSQAVRDEMKRVKQEKYIAEGARLYDGS